MQQAVIEKLSRIVQDLPSLPAVVQEVLALLSDPMAQPEDLEKAMSRDPALSLKVLRIANSAYYRRGREISSLSDAIILLGYKSVRSLVLTSAVQGVLSGAEGVAAKLWEHCFAVGGACREAAKLAGLSPAEREEAFLAGLFHDVGKGAIAQRFPGIYIRSLDWRGEVDALDFHHGDLGRALLQKWEIPEVLCAAVGGHHEENPQGFSALIVVGNWLAEPVAEGIQSQPRPVPEALLAQFHIDRDEVERIRELLAATISEERGAGVR